MNGRIKAGVAHKTLADSAPAVKATVVKAPVVKATVATSAAAGTNGKVTLAVTMIAAWVNGKAAKALAGQDILAKAMAVKALIEV